MAASAVLGPCLSTGQSHDEFSRSCPLPSLAAYGGELRVSALYPPGTLPRRLRLIEPSSAPERTIGYVEIPLNSPLEVDRFIDRYVGVRAGNIRLMEGGVDPVLIYVAKELVLLDAGTGATGDDAEN